ncbi:MAG: TRAP transporter substrate-binding protein [Janthinobacterium lividum]
MERRRFLQIAQAGAVACVTAPYALGAHAQSAKFKLKWANTFPADHPINVRIAEALKQINQESNGQVAIQFFPNGLLGSETDSLSQLRAGSIDFLSYAGTGLAPLVPVASLSDVPFSFKTYAQIWPAMDGDLGAYIRENIEKYDIHCLDRCFDLGFRELTSGTRRVRAPEDLKGFKIRVPVNPMYTSLWETLGAAPTSINFSEAYSALQTHLVDGQENPLATIEISKFYEVQKYCSMTNHMWINQWNLCNQKSWNKLPADVQQLINKHMDQAVVLERADLAKISADAEAFLKGKGLVFDYPQASAFRDALSKGGFYSTWRKKLGPVAWAKLEKYAGQME